MGPPAHRTPSQRVADALLALPPFEQARVVAEACERLGFRVRRPAYSCDVKPGSVRRVRTKRRRAAAAPLLVL